MKFRQAVWDEPLLIEKSREGRTGYSLPDLGPGISAASREKDDFLPGSMRRKDLPLLPEISEPEVVRHFLRLSQKNFAIDLGM